MFRSRVGGVDATLPSPFLTCPYAFEALELHDPRPPARLFFSPTQTTFLYETYGDIVSPIEGVLNEHFIVWMRTAGLSQFRKVYGRIDEELSPLQVLKFNITSSESRCLPENTPFKTSSDLRKETSRLGATTCAL